MNFEIVENFIPRSGNPSQATHAHKDVSARYAFISTTEILSKFAEAGWRVVREQSAQTRKADRVGFQKHLITLEHADYQSMPGLTGNSHAKPQLVLINSHDRGSSLRILWGMYRMVCANGIIAGTTMSEVRLRHSASTLGRLQGAIAAQLANLPKMQQQVQALASKQLTAAATERLIKTVYDARVSAVKGLREVEYRMPRLRRYEDQGNDAWTVFNRIQEVAVRGGINYTYDRNTKGDQGQMLYTNLSYARTRAVKAIDEQARINGLCYDTALELVG